MDSVNANSKKKKTPDLVVVGQKTEEKAARPASRKPIDIPLSFDAWWLQIQSEHKLRPELKNSVKRHFEAKGFLDSKKFNDGLRDFGFRT